MGKDFLMDGKKSLDKKRGNISSPPEEKKKKTASVRPRSSNISFFTNRLLAKTLRKNSLTMSHKG